MTDRRQPDDAPIEPTTERILAEYPPPKEKGGVVKGADAERKTSEASEASQATTRVTHEVTHKSESSKAGGLAVLDCTFVELMKLGPSDREEHDIHWLKQQVLERRGRYELKAGEEVLMYVKFGQWLPDDMQIKKAIGNENRVFFFIRRPHADPFNISVRLVAPRLESQVLTLPVADQETIRVLKQRIAAEYKIAVAHQRLVFQGTLLDDDHTIGFYKLPAESTLELNVVPI